MLNYLVRSRLGAEMALREAKKQRNRKALEQKVWNAGTAAAGAAPFFAESSKIQGKYSEN
jgi:hypothetical protein